MQAVVNHLIQLQELLMIRDEQKVLGGSDHLQRMDAAISTMKSQLQGDVRQMFERLQKKDFLVMVPVSDGICAACGLRLPISLVQAVKMYKEIHSCPSCARMLYAPESAPRRIVGRTRRTDPPKIGITRFSSHTLMIPKLEAEDKEGAIKELAFKMEHEGFVDKAGKLVEEALRREAIISTAVDHGVAFPHVRGVEGGGLTFALGMSQKGIKFDSEGTPTKLIFFIVIPMAASAFYLKLLSGLTEALMKPDARKALLAEKDDPEKLWKALVKVTKATIK